MIGEWTCALWREEESGETGRVYLVPGRSLVYIRSREGKVTVRREDETGFINRKELWKEAAGRALMAEDRQLREVAIKVLGKLGKRAESKVGIAGAAKKRAGRKKA